MSIDWPAELVQAIARRRAVVLIGSGVSANSINAEGKRPPTWGSFLTSIYRSTGSKIPHIIKTLQLYQYLEACEYLKSELGPKWSSAITEAFRDPNFKPADIHRAIFNLDARIVASLNFDKIYESYASKASEGSVIVKNYYDDDIRQVLTGTGRYVLKPHGTVDTVSRMIFTVDEYARARIEYSAFYDILSALLHTHTFLCIGCGLSDPDMKLLFENYRYRYGEVPHFIVLPKPISASECKLIEKTRGMQVLTYSPKQGHEELTKSLDDLVTKIEPARAEIAQAQNW